MPQSNSSWLGMRLCWAVWSRAAKFCCLVTCSSCCRLCSAWKEKEKNTPISVRASSQMTCHLSHLPGLRYQFSRALSANCMMAQGNDGKRKMFNLVPRVSPLHVTRRDPGNEVEKSSDRGLAYWPGQAREPACLQQNLGYLTVFPLLA